MELPGAAVQTIGQSTAASTEQVSCIRDTQEKMAEKFQWENILESISEF